VTIAGDDPICRSSGRARTIGHSRVEFVGADADLGAEAVFAAVGKAC
jgi:hypothetical protein